MVELVEPPEQRVAREVKGVHVEAVDHVDDLKSNVDVGITGITISGDWVV